MDSLKNPNFAQQNQSNNFSWRKLVTRRTDVTLGAAIVMNDLKDTFLPQHSWCAVNIFTAFKISPSRSQNTGAGILPFLWFPAAGNGIHLWKCLMPGNIIYDLWMFYLPRRSHSITVSLRKQWRPPSHGNGWILFKINCKTMTEQLSWITLLLWHCFTRNA